MGKFRSTESYKSKDPRKRERSLDNLLKRWNQKPKKSPAFSGREWSSNFYTNRCIDFIEQHCYIPDAIGVNGKVGPGLVKLEKWQKKVIKDLLQKDPKTGLRRYNMGLISTPKKNGKTSTAVFLITWFLAHGENAGEIIVASNSKDQSSWVIFNKLTRNILLHPSMSRKMKMRDDSIENKETGTIVRTAAPNFKTISGANPSVVCYDELWAYDTAAHRAFFDELTTVPTRREPMCLIVSYAGMDTDSLLYDLYIKGKEKSDPKMFFFWTNLNISSWITRDYLQDQRRRLKPNVFRRLHANEWCSFQESFLDLADWDSCVDERHKPIPANRNVQIIVGVDIGYSKDSSCVTALTRMRWGNGSIIALCCHRIWKPPRLGQLKLQLIEDYIIDLSKIYRIRAVAYDPWQMVNIAQNLKKLYIPMIEIPQIPNNLVSMSTRLYEMIQNHELLLYKDRLMRQHAEFSLARVSERGVSISKKKSGRHIDAIVSLALALTQADKIYTVSSAGLPQLGPARWGGQFGTSLDPGFNAIKQPTTGIRQPPESRYHDPTKKSPYITPGRLARPMKIDYEE